MSGRQGKNAGPRSVLQIACREQFWLRSPAHQMHRQPGALRKGEERQEESPKRQRYLQLGRNERVVTCSAALSRLS